MEGAGKHDIEAAEKAARNVGELVKEAESRNVEAQTYLEQATFCAQAPHAVVMPGSPTAEKWVIADQECGVLRVKHEARQMLTTVPAGKPLNIVTILGAARRGKSFMMNALTGHDDLFPVSPNVAPCTAGADISPFLASLSDFERGGGSQTSHVSPVTPEPTIAFVDMEGQGDKSNEHGVRLATTFLVVSKVSNVLQSAPLDRSHSLTRTKPSSARHIARISHRWSPARGVELRIIVSIVAFSCTVHANRVLRWPSTLPPLGSRYSEPSARCAHCIRVVWGPCSMCGAQARMTKP